MNADFGDVQVILSDKEAGKIWEKINEQQEKLNTIEEGAEINVQPDWNQTDDTQDDYIKNKPDVPTIAEIEEDIDGLYAKKSVENEVKTLRRKVLPMTGAVKRIEKKGGRVSSVSETLEEGSLVGRYFNVSYGGNSLSFDSFDDEDNVNFGTLKYIRGYGPNGTSYLYLLLPSHWSGEGVTLNSVSAKFYFDGVETDPDDIEKDMEFTVLMIDRTVSLTTTISDVSTTITQHVVHLVSHTGIRTFILSSYADSPQKARFNVTENSMWQEVYDGGEVIIYDNPKDRVVTMRRDTSFSSSTWYKYEINW